MRAAVSRSAWPLLAAAVVLALFVVGAGQAAVGSARGPSLERYIVRVEPGAAGDVLQAVQALGGRHVERLEFVPNTHVVALNERAAEALAARPNVVYVERDQLMTLVHHACGHTGGPPGSSPPPGCEEPTPTPTPTPDDGGGGGAEPQVTPWGVAKIQAPGAWVTWTGSGVAVCIADTGIAPDHEDLPAPEKARNFSAGGPFSSPDPNKWQDGNGHGTHVAGTVAALDNGVGVVGVAPDATLYVAKVLKDNGSGWTSQIANGLGWCADAGAAIINMSFGGGDSATLKDAIVYAAGKDVVLVAASGNSGASSPGYPAAYPEVIAVGATDSNDVIASWSNRGEEVNAPGVSILSTVPGGYDTYSGTSMASPHAAGTAALIIAAGEADPIEADPIEVRRILKDRADPIAGGAVRINANSAVGAAVSP
ncbi:MAG: hypothetical protein Kow0010_25000 [Dehalococcoidia bacterium]